MTAVPNTYSEWVTVLTDFKNKKNDEDVLRAMKAGSIQWQSGVAERFSRKLIEAVNFRMNAASDKFQKDLSRSHGQEGAIVQAILSLRKEMAFLPALPDDERKHYLALVIEQADNMQKSLEDSAKNDRSGRMSSIVRNHRVNSF